MVLNRGTSKGCPEGTGGNAGASQWKGELVLKTNFRILLYILSLGLLLTLPLFTASGCSSGNSTTTASSVMTSAAGTTTTTTSQYAIAVFVNGKLVASLTPADLAKLPQVKANIGGTDEQGPTFTAAITSIGVTDFTEVTVSGFTQGRVATADLTLKKSEITDNVMLAIVKRGTVKLTGTDIGAAKAIIDVNKIAVK